ncbi:MAG: AAA family ATPase, partial [Alphaproteobacteria bacterium]
MADLERNRQAQLNQYRNIEQERLRMDISIKSCNSIDEATIHIDEGFLNIKYGINGTGKSTIAKAIELNSQDPAKLAELTPFKLLEDNPNDLKPVVEGCDGISSVAVFNESYVGQFVFKQDELIKNSFEIFVKTNDYQQKLEEIEGITAEIKHTFKDNEEIDKVVSDLIELGGCFGRAKSGYSAASSIGKGIGGGNKIENIPVGLEPYTEFLQSDQNTSWIKWQINGNSFLELSDNCPYCTSPAKEKHNEIKKVSDEFDAKSIEHLTKVLSVVERLDQYFSEDARNQIFAITRNKTGLTEEDITYLKQVKEQIDTLQGKMMSLKSITFFTFEDVDKVVEAIQPLKINLASLPYLNSEETKTIVDKLNNSLDTVLQMGGQLQGKVNQQKEVIRKTVEARKEEINGFLHYAGYKYTVEIEGDAQQYKLKLQHHDMSNT